MENVEPSIQSNKIHSTYKDLEEYLDIQFRLLREDFIAPLREIISTCNEVRDLKKLKENSICRSSIFENLVIIEKEDKGFATVYWLDLSAHSKKLIDFENCKRFLSGNIVCIFNSTFTTMRICTIYDKMVSGRNNKTLKVGIMGTPHDEHDSSQQSYILVESPAFYKAYAPVLKQLQKLSYIPFARNILYRSTELSPPAYLRKETQYDITAILKDELKQSVKIVRDRFSWRFDNDISLNYSQLRALRHCLTRELAIVQGPPGTGKTFLAIKLAETLLANRKVWSNNGGHGALLIVCQTNHALDQFLEGILKFNENIIRIGSRCKSKILKNKLLHRILTGEAYIDMKYEKNKEIEHLQDISKYIEEAVIGIETFVEFGIFTEEIASGINTYGGIWKLLNIKSPEAVVEKAKAEVMVCRIYMSTMIYMVIFSDCDHKSYGMSCLVLIMILCFQLEKCTDDMNSILKQKERHESMSEEEVLLSAEVIGMTTTGAAQFATKLENAFIPIVIVEEASEVLEAHIITALNKNVKHLIMIGDHKQLRPSPASFKMADKHKLDISFFERMILNGLKYDQLLIQRRMRPEISQLIHPHIYKHLKNDISVMEYPNVRGVGKNVFFVNHSFYEEKLEDNPSKINLYEAEMVLELARYLILQDYSPDRITILTTYSAQLAHLKAMISNSKRFYLLSDVKVYVVDNYQGEENDIILLSLVRSNRDRSIGFLKIENRVCVALSRAKIGFYCFGNFDLLCGISPLWRGIIETLKKSSLYGEELLLYCQQHVDNIIQVKYVNDFKLAAEGGCNRWCNSVLNCGHLCTRHCHSFDLSHGKFICKKSCKKKIPDCRHNGRMKCYLDPEEFDCPIVVSRKIPSCGHKQNMACSDDLHTFVCKARCEEKLDCGHSCQNKCGEECPEECSVTTRRYAFSLVLFVSRYTFGQPAIHSFAQISAFSLDSFGHG
ncbi:NFX1-type zinc finger-containing protein 1 [Nymphon striatum]|nr:NFX1-type zinc finger-containing protein 1 [Nymphon striatum]